MDFIREKYMSRLTSANRLVGLIGQRGVGKSTLLLQYLKLNYKVTEYLYFSADDIYIVNSSIYDIADEFVRLGGKVIVIDDVATTGNSIIKAVDILRAEGIEVQKAVVLVDRNEGAKEKLREINCELISLFNIEEFL